jgi:S-formylglutathione hydrolase FrmB
VVYMLHGLGGSEGNWVAHGELARSADAIDAPFIVVMPDGDDGFYTNGEQALKYEACMARKPPFDPSEAPASYCVKTPAYEDYVTKDLLPHIDARYRTSTDRRKRAVGGLSMGGYGAMALALRHQELFSAVASHSGMVYLTGTSEPRGGASIHDADGVQGWGTQYGAAFRAYVKGVMGASISQWRERDPTLLAAKLEPGALAIMIDCGTSDGFQFQHHARRLHEVLASRNIVHEYALEPGGHDWAYWKARLPFSLKFFAAALEPRPK